MPIEFGRDQRHALQDDAALLQPLDALPARALRQPDAMGDLRQRQAGVVLKQRHDLAIDRVHVLSAGGHCGVSLDRLRFKLHGGTEARAEQGGEGLDVAIDRAGIVDEPGVGAGEPGQPPGARLADQRAHDAAAGRYGPEGGLDAVRQRTRATLWARASMRRH